MAYRTRGTASDTVAVNVRLTEDTYRLLAAAAAVAEQSMTAYAEQAIIAAARRTLRGHDVNRVLATLATTDKRRAVIDRLAGKDQT